MSFLIVVKNKSGSVSVVMDQSGFSLEFPTEEIAVREVDKLMECGKRACEVQNIPEEMHPEISQFYLCDCRELISVSDLKF